MQHGWLLASVGALALGCSSDDVLPELPDDPLVLLRVCVDPAAQVVVNSVAGLTDFSLTGRVEELGSDVQDPLASTGCAFPSDYRLGSAPTDVAPGALSWARVRSTEDPAALSQVSVLAAGFSFAGLDGEDVVLQFHSGPLGFVVAPQWLELRRADGALLFWMAEAASVPELVGASEIQRSEGLVSSRRRGDDCTPDWAEHSLDVSVGGQRASVRPRERAAVGDRVVTNRAVNVQTGGTACEDAGVAFASAAAWPVELDVEL